MEDRETPRTRKYEESKTFRIMMATVPQVTSGSGLRKFQADGFFVGQSAHEFIGIIGGMILTRETQSTGI